MEINENQGQLILNMADVIVKANGLQTSPAVHELVNAIKIGFAPVNFSAPNQEIKMQPEGAQETEQASETADEEVKS